MVAVELVGLAHAAPFLGSMAYDRCQIRKNRRSRANSCGIVLVPEVNFGYTLAQQLLCERGRLARFFTQNEIGLDWRYNATRQDLLDAVNDPAYNSIALMGPSTRSSWNASDGVVGADDILGEWCGKKKNGLWVQWDVGGEYARPLGYDIMEDADNILGRRLQSPEEEAPDKRMAGLLTDRLSVLRYVG